MPSVPDRPPHAFGRRIKRVEDPALLRGEGRYVGDIAIPGTLHAAFVRSPRPHGRLLGIDAEAARAAPGVVGVYTHAELAGLGAALLPIGWRHAGQRLIETELLAAGKVRWVGEPVAVVLADDAYAAEDAAELVQLEIEDLPGVASVDAAAAAGAPRLYEDWPDNVLVEYLSGVPIDDAVFATAPVRIHEQFFQQRQAVSSIEARGTMARYDHDRDRVTAWISTQRANGVREAICAACDWPEDRLHVIAPDVGGAFGLKEEAFAEEVLVCLLAYHRRRPVRWVEDRREALIGSAHARQCQWDLELAADADGRILGIRGEVLLDVGGQPSSQGIGPARIAADMLGGPYRVPEHEVRVRGLMTNKAPMGAYRGYGLPEAVFAMERLIELIAREIGADAAEVRRRNFIPPEAFPYRTVTDRNYDSGEYATALDLALEMADHDGLAARKAASRERGRRRGLGIASFVKSCGLPSSPNVAHFGFSFGNHETVTVRMDRTGKATVLTGISSQGQGHKTIMAQICAEVLGLDPERDVTVIQGDTDVTPYSTGSATASRSTMLGGRAIFAASEKLSDKLKQIAAHQLEAAVADIELVDGHAAVLGVPSARVPLRDLGKAAMQAFDLPEGVEPGLEATVTMDSPGSAFSFGTHVVEIELDPVTGRVDVQRYIAVNDCGTQVNPALVEGQLLGGIAQGFGSAMLEEIVYDAEGQILTASFMDYMLPTAEDMPVVEIAHTYTPAPHITGGMKGVGELGTLGPPAALANAVADAIGPGAPNVNRLPLTPQAVAAWVERAA